MTASTFDIYCRHLSSRYPGTRYDDLFANGRSQGVRLPREFRFAGREVRIRRFGMGVLLEPVEIDVDAWFEALDRFEEPLMPDGRYQPATPSRRVFG